MERIGKGPHPTACEVVRRARPQRAQLTPGSYEHISQNDVLRMVQQHRSDSQGVALLVVQS